MAKKAEATVSVSIPAIDIRTFELKIVGDSPLIVHAWSVKAQQMMLDKQMKKATKGKEAKNPFEDFCHSLYWLDNNGIRIPVPESLSMTDVQAAKFGFPVIAFKAAAVDGGYQSGVTANKTTSRGAFHVTGEYAVIDGTPEMREDMVRVGMGTADIRYRAEFKKWSTVLLIRYNVNAMSMEQIINLFNVGGFACGVGEWRPSKDGSYGMFHVG